MAWFKRWSKRLTWVFGALLVLTALVWLGLPPLIKSQAQSRGSAALGRPLGIGDVRIEPFKLALTLSDLSIGAAGAVNAAVAVNAAGAAGAASTPPLLRIARIRVEADIASVWQRAPVLRALEVDAPQVYLTRTADGHYDIDDLIERFTLPKPKPDAAPARFALNNLQVKGGSILFDDRPVGRVHRVENLTIGLPFLSNLPSQVAIKVQPRLQFTLNGTAFDSGAIATPFAQTREADLQLKLAPLDVAPYLGYLPAALPVRLLRAKLEADLKLQFSQPASKPDPPSAESAPQVQLTGWITARELALTDRANAPLLDWRELRVDLRDVQPLKRQVHLAALKLDGAHLVAVREANGASNWQRLATDPAAQPTQPDAAVKAAAPAQPNQASASAAAAMASPATPATSAWTFALDDLQLSAAQVQLTDNAVRPRAQWLVDGIAVQVQQLRWPNTTAMPLQAVATLHKGADASPAIGTLAVKGQASPQQAALEMQLDGLQLEPLAPYLAQVLTPQVSGKLTAQATLDWSGAADAPRLQVNLAKATLESLRLADGAGRAAPTLMAWQQLGLAAVQADLLAHKLSLGSVKLSRPTLHLARNSAGDWNLQRWPASAATPTTSTTAPTVLTKAVATPPSPRTAGAAAIPKADAAWTVVLKELSVDAGQVMLSDAAPGATTGTSPTGANRNAASAHPTGPSAQALKFDLSNLRLRLNDLAWPAASGQPIKLQLAAQLGPTVGVGTNAGSKPAAASIDWNGRLGLAPLQASGAVAIERLDLHPYEPYFGALLPVHLQQAQASLKGQVKLRQAADGLQVELGADVRVADLFVRTRPLRLPGQPAPEPDSGDELLSWQSLVLDGVSVALAPGAATQVEIRAVALSDFYSRLTITEQGRFNLSDVAPEPAHTGPPASAASAAPAPLLVIGPTRLVNGRIDFTDRFVRPSYSTRLTELNGQIGAFRSGTRDMAAIELRGRAEGTALLDIVGQLNPTANPLALDIRAKATDLELAPLSPYAGKYAGYAIERGKLSMDVSYKIDPDGKLEAKNQVILNQLTFGEKVDSPSATSLPVRLAVALLKDRNGVIDINLPVSGSLSDPQFSVSGIVIKVIVNLLTKAFTAPFALLSGGGADDLSVVGFQPGAAVMTEPGQQALDKVAKALMDRPALTMTVAGAADPTSERDAIQRLALDARLSAERRRELGRGSSAAAAVPPVSASPAASGATHDAADPTALPALTAEDRSRLLKVVYQQTNLPNKPRNALGLLRDLPAAEMDAMLRAATVVSTDSARDLALQRGITVRDALVARGLPSSRLFLSAPKLRASTEDDAAWSPRVQLTLAAP